MKAEENESGRFLNQKTLGHHSGSLGSRMTRWITIHLMEPSSMLSEFHGRRFERQDDPQGIDCCQSTHESMQNSKTPNAVSDRLLGSIDNSKCHVIDLLLGRDVCPWRFLMMVVGEMRANHEQRSAAIDGHESAAIDWRMIAG